MHLAQLGFQLVGFTLVRRQLLTQCGGGLALGFFVGFIRVDRRVADRRVAQTIIRQPACVVIQIAVELFDFAIRHQQEVVGGALEQVAIVRHHQYRTTELLQSHGQRQAHFQVQVVGGFVEQQQVRSVPGDQCQGQTRFFATGEIQYRLIDARTTEVKATEEVAQGLLTLGRRQTLQVQQRAGLGIEGVQLMLGKVAHHQVLATGQTAGQRLQFTRQVLDQCRLAGAVRAEQTNTCARRELQLDLLQNGFVAIPQTRIRQVQQRAGDLHRLTKYEVERRINVGRRQLFHALQRLDPALGLTGLGGLGLEPGDVAFHVRALRLLLLESLLLLRQTLGTRAFERGVAATVEGDFLLFDVGDVVDHGIEEIPVVGNQQQSTWVALEEVFQPQDRIEVQVVGRFVEQ